MRRAAQHARIDQALARQQVLLEKQQAEGLVADEQGVYWTTRRPGDGEVMMLPAGSALPVMLTKVFGGRDVAVDATRVYYTSETDGTVSAVEK